MQNYRTRQKTHLLLALILMLFSIVTSSCTGYTEIEQEPDLDGLPKAVGASMQIVGEEDQAAPIEYKLLLDAIGEAERVADADLTNTMFAIATVNYSDGSEQTHSLYIEVERAQVYILDEDTLLKLPEAYFGTLLDNEHVKENYVRDKADVTAAYGDTDLPNTLYTVKLSSGKLIKKTFSAVSAPLVSVGTIDEFKPKFSKTPDNYTVTLIDREGAVVDEVLPGEYLCEIEAAFSGQCWAGTVTYQAVIEILGDPKLVLSSDVAAQGEVITVLVQGAAPNVEYEIYMPHLEKTVPVYTNPSGSIAFVQLNITAPTGSHVLELRQKGNSAGGQGDTIDTATYTIQKTDFRRQDLQTSDETQSIYTNTNINSDNERVAAAYSKSFATPLWDGLFIRPVEGKITTEFGQMRYVNEKLQSIHGALDIAAAEGTDVMAAAGGKVVFAEELIVSGNTVIIDHGMNVFSSYSHLSAFTSKAGDAVRQGDVIGLVGSTGYSTGPHLHYAVRINGYYVSPMFMEEIDILMLTVALDSNN